MQIWTIPWERRRLRKVILEYRPDVMNVHYASAAGLLSVGLFHPTIVTVYGSDVTEFPERSPIHRGILRHVLANSQAITTASRYLKRRVEGLGAGLPTPSVVPFGIDLSRFSRESGLMEPGTQGLVIGTTKGNERVYGIDILLQAFARLRTKIDDAIPLKLVIVGGGTQEEANIDLAKKLHIDPLVEFRGRVPNSDIPAALGEFDVFVALSRSESFGVAVIEAMAMAIPCLVSDVGGLPEIVGAGNGIVVSQGSVVEASDALELLLTDVDLRGALGRHGQAHAREHYGRDVCVGRMLQIYRAALS